MDMLGERKKKPPPHIKKKRNEKHMKDEGNSE